MVSQVTLRSFASAILIWAILICTACSAHSHQSKITQPVREFANTGELFNFIFHEFTDYYYEFGHAPPTDHWKKLKISLAGSGTVQSIVILMGKEVEPYSNLHHLNLEVKTSSGENLSNTIYTKVGQRDVSWFVKTSETSNGQYSLDPEPFNVATYLVAGIIDLEKLDKMISEKQYRTVEMLQLMDYHPDSETYRLIRSTQLAFVITKDRQSIIAIHQDKTFNYPLNGKSYPSIKLSSKIEGT